MHINKEITGIDLDDLKLFRAIEYLQICCVQVRINCNIIKGYIDSDDEILNFIEFAKELGVDGVRFAELKNDDRFVDLADIFPDGMYGLNKDPFIHGCWQNAIIDDMPVNFRQLCGMQSEYRPTIVNPKQILKKVLYYDGKMYDGWQKGKLIDEGENMKKNIKGVLKTILSGVQDGDVSVSAAVKIIEGLLKTEQESTSCCGKSTATATVKVDQTQPGGTGSGCVY
jgi:hypothetical protein